ncbi:MAG: AEC family transporter [Spirochaetaceae bacterium]
MLLDIAVIFLNVIVPVMVVVAIGYFAGPRLSLDSRTLSRSAFYIFIPAFVFKMMLTAEIEAELAVRMIAYIAVVHVGIALFALILARLLRKSAEMVAAFVLVAVFGNFGNFGLPFIEFRLGTEALVAATVYLLTMNVVAFPIGVAAASWHRGGTGTALLSVLKTPALIALVPALGLNILEVDVPRFGMRIVDLLAAAMVPVMILSIGTKLAEAPRLRIDVNVVTATAVRLIGTPILAIALAVPFALEGVPRGAGILQSSMPTAVIASIIAIEYDLLPEFVTEVVLFSTLAGFATLTLVMTIV